MGVCDKNNFPSNPVAKKFTNGFQRRENLHLLYSLTKQLGQVRHVVECVSWADAIRNNPLFESSIVKKNTNGFQKRENDHLFYSSTKELHFIEKF